MPLSPIEILYGRGRITLSEDGYSRDLRVNAALEMQTRFSLEPTISRHDGRKIGSINENNIRQMLSQLKFDYRPVFVSADAKIKIVQQNSDVVVFTINDYATPHDSDWLNDWTTVRKVEAPPTLRTIETLYGRGKIELAEDGQSREIAMTYELKQGGGSMTTFMTIDKHDGRKIGKINEDNIRQMLSEPIVNTPKVKVILTMEDREIKIVQQNSEAVFFTIGNPPYEKEWVSKWFIKKEKRLTD